MKEDKIVKKVSINWWLWLVAVSMLVIAITPEPKSKSPLVLPAPPPARVSRAYEIPSKFTVQWLEDQFWGDRALRESTVMLFLALDGYEPDDGCKTVDGDQAYKIVRASQAVFAMYERRQNRYGFASALEAQPIIRLMLLDAMNALSQRCCCDKLKPVDPPLSNAYYYLRDCYRQISSGQPIERAGV